MIRSFQEASVNQHHTKVKFILNFKSSHFKAKPLARELKPAIEAIHFITEKLRLEDQAETVEDDWQYIAMICDRVLLLLYSIAGMIGTLVIFQKVWESKPWSGDACY